MKTKIKSLFPLRGLGGFLLCISLITNAQTQTNGGSTYLMNLAKDMSTDFNDFTNIFFFAEKLASFDPQSGVGTIEWKRKSLYTRQAFNTNTILAQDLAMLDFPPTEYDANPKLKFSIDFVTPSTVRVRMLTSPVELKQAESLMLVKTPAKDNSWKYTRLKNAHRYEGANGVLLIEENPIRISLLDKKGKVLTCSRHLDILSIGRESIHGEM